MNRVFALNQRYIHSDILVRHGVELVAVGDAPGRVSIPPLADSSD